MNEIFGEFREFSEQKTAGDDSLKDFEDRAFSRLENLFDKIEKISPFEKKSETELTEGLSVTNLERGEKTENLSEQSFSPSDYTEKAYINEKGELVPGQIELEKLTDEAMENISGDIMTDIPLWTRQSEPSSCAINSQCFAINALTGKNITEQELIQQAEALNIYDGNGTAPYDVGKLAELHGLEYEQMEKATLEDIEDVLDSGGKVITGISSVKMLYPHMFGFFRADHAVEVIGIDRNDPEDVRVILNDPGRENGAGVSIPEDVYMKAWKGSNRHMVGIYPGGEK